MSECRDPTKWRLLQKVIGVRWVDVNKVDTADLEYRPRLVGRELSVGRDDALYAATPPLEAVGLIISHAATIPVELESHNHDQ